MENALYIALSQQVALRKSVDIIAHNVANASTAGFKAEHMVFSEVLAENVDGQPMSFVKDEGVDRDFSEGGFITTGKAFDVALHGEGWFVVDTEFGLRYTRNGQFQVDETGQLVTAQGDVVLDENNNPIVLQPDDHDITITATGEVLAREQSRGRLQVVDFEDEDTALTQVSSSLFLANEAAEPATGFRIAQGMIEGSNVKPIIEIVGLMSALRSYQSTQKFIDEENRRQTKMIETLTQSTT